MKRCPTCNRTFDDDWLAFCTEDGTTLVETQSGSLPSEPPPTVWIPPALDTNPATQKPFDLPGSYNPPQPVKPEWRPPPPPTYQTTPQQGLAIASMIVGLISITIGWCYVGLVTGPIAIALAIVALVQIKNKPDSHGGKPFAIVGLITGAIPFIGLLLIFVLAIVMSSMK
jgi:hypothetical protein